MLVLGVTEGDYIMIGDNIKVRVLKTGDIFRLAIDAPRDMLILRKSLYEASNPGYEDEEFERPRPKKAAVK